jgi:hypothetical protein
MEDVNRTIDMYQSAHLSSLSEEQVRNALSALAEQQNILIIAADEEQLVDTQQEQEFLTSVLARLVKVLTIYEDHLSSISVKAPTTAHLPVLEEESPDSAYDSPGTKATDAVPLKINTNL